MLTGIYYRKRDYSRVSELPSNKSLQFLLFLTYVMLAAGIVPKKLMLPKLSQTFLFSERLRDFGHSWNAYCLGDRL